MDKLGLIIVIKRSVRSPISAVNKHAYKFNDLLFLLSYFQG